MIVPAALFENVLSPTLFQINLLAGVLLISKKKSLMQFAIGLLILAGVLFASGLTEISEQRSTDIARMSIYFLFYVVVAFETIKQVWKSKKISLNVIFGVISGYLSLGLIGFFICLSVELIEPGSFQGLPMDGVITESQTDRLIYFSFITLLTVGYGDILPVSLPAEKATVLIGLMGQFYLVIITATIVGKYINQTTKNNENK
ncbi:MAG: potassium channel family protein [Bacteroidota bacterium]